MSSRKPAAPAGAAPGGWGDYQATAGGGTLSYSQVDADVLRAATAAVGAAGDAIMFSVTSDGGAYAVATYHAGRRDSRYFTDVGSLQEALQYLVRVY